jgi:hypothetical protein
MEPKWIGMYATMFSKSVNLMVLDGKIGKF